MVEPKDQQFVDLPELLNSGDLVAFNDTKVMKAKGCFGKSQWRRGRSIGRCILQLPMMLIEQAHRFCVIRASRSPKRGANAEICRCYNNGLEVF